MHVQNTCECILHEYLNNKYKRQRKVFQADQKTENIHENILCYDSAVSVSIRE